MERFIKIGDRYKHFKGHLYEVISIAKDCEDLKEMVVYRNVETGEEWVREKSEFLSEVDHEKYPEIKQNYRCEKIK